MFYFPINIGLPIIPIDELHHFQDGVAKNHQAVYDIPRRVPKSWTDIDHFTTRISANPGFFCGFENQERWISDEYIWPFIMAVVVLKEATTDTIKDLTVLLGVQWAADMDIKWIAILV